VDLNKQKEQFSNAYVRAVASVAGCSATIPEVDEDSVDLILKKKLTSDYEYRFPQIDVQIKCTSQQDVITDKNIVFPLKIKNYDGLRQKSLAPRFLVVVVVPDLIEDWLYQNEEQMILKKCGYWLSLKGMAETQNPSTVNVYIPRNQMFTINQLADWMNKIGNGEFQ
jgi:hypothetical protein